MDFEVRIIRTESRLKVFHVQADNAEKAKEKALSWAGDAEFPRGEAEYEAASCESLETATDVAKTFCRYLRKELTGYEIDAINDRNAVQTDPNICHSHDFCDANMPMDAAMKRHGHSTAVGCEKLWDEAWKKAQAAGFDADKVV